MKNLAFITFVSHNIYKWWIYFFNEKYNFSLFDNKLLKYDLKVKNNFFIWKYKMFNLPTNLLVKLYQDPVLDKNKYDFIIIWDIFVLLICFKYIFKKNTIFYSEFFFKKSDSMIKKVLFYIWTLSFRNKKFIVPSKLAKTTFLKISNNVFYFPPIYYWNIYKNHSLKDKKLKIIFVGRLGYKMKNLNFLLDVLSKLDFDFEVKLCGNMAGYSKDYNKYKKILWNKLIYKWYLNKQELSTEFQSSNLFVLPSLSEPIWSVLLEAMWHSLPIIVSSLSGSSDYIEDGENGFIYDNNKSWDLLSKIILLNDVNQREKFWKKSYNIILDEYYYKNEKLLNQKYKLFNNFIKKS